MEKIRKITVRKFSEEIKRHNWTPLYEIVKEGEDEISIYGQESLIKEIRDYSNNGSSKKVRIINKLSPEDCGETVFKKIELLVALNNVYLESCNKLKVKENSLKQLVEVYDAILSQKIFSKVKL